MTFLFDFMILNLLSHIIIIRNNFFIKSGRITVNAINAHVANITTKTYETNPLRNGLPAKISGSRSNAAGTEIVRIRIVSIVRINVIAIPLPTGIPLL